MDSAVNVFNVNVSVNMSCSGESADDTSNVEGTCSDEPVEMVSGGVECCVSDEIVAESELDDPLVAKCL